MPLQPQECHLTRNILDEAGIENEVVSGGYLSAGELTQEPPSPPSVCIVSCGNGTSPVAIVRRLKTAFPARTNVYGIVLTEDVVRSTDINFVCVPAGTKLSKLRRLADLVEADLVCICDPDLRINSQSCLQVLAAAEAKQIRGNEIIAFGVVAGVDDGSLLSGVIAVDKWWSHRVLRHSLWKLGVGITIPGQFFVASTSVFQRLDPDVDSYLDDLYLGWIARTSGVEVLRIPAVVGQEESRTHWGSLLSQRLRWMKGLARLLWHLAGHPLALALIGMHYFAYHGLPMLAAFGLALLAFASPLAAIGVFSLLTVALTRSSRLPATNIIAFLIVFPVLHVLASTLWWVPSRRSYLLRR
jgi:cellulose synthase/poly-beta-1,6-N-acetylglucosamine synthase-like glycosyltransferase